MSTNIPSYQNGQPHPIDNETPPKSITSKGQTSFKAIQASIDRQYTQNPQTLQEVIGNIRVSLSTLSGKK